MLPQRGTLISGREAMSSQPNSVDLIRELIAFPTVSRDTNRELLLFVERFLAGHGVACDILWTPDGKKGNLWATIRPKGRGCILSGHSDVVPVDGQVWASRSSVWSVTLTRAIRLCWLSGRLDSKAVRRSADQCSGPCGKSSKVASTSAAMPVPRIVAAGRTVDRERKLAGGFGR